MSKRKNKFVLKFLTGFFSVLLVISIYNVFYNFDVRENSIESKVKSVSEEDKDVVVIDIGHGGNDQGTQNLYSGVVEKDITLEIGMKIEQILKEDSSIEVLTTRTTDVYLSLKDRINFSNNKNADVFVSIHCNADPAGTSSINGVETFYWKDDTQESKNLAQAIQSSIVNSLDVKDRGIKKEEFAVIKSTKCPSVLVETGFLSNNIEANNLSNDDYQEKMAEAIVDGIKEYLTEN